MSQVQQLLESAASGWKNMQSDAAKLAGKWQRTGLLEGLGETDRNNMSMLLENQAKQLVTETSAVGSNLGGFSTGQSPTGNWAGIALPLVRKVFGQISAKEFVSVQPMNLPSGLVFFLDFQYGTGKAPFGANNSLYGNTGSAFPFATNANNLNANGPGGLYGAGRFTFSTNQFSSSALDNFETGSGTSHKTITTGSSQIALSELNFDAGLSASLAAGKVFKAFINTSSIPGFDPDAIRGFVLNSGSSATGTGFATTANALPQLTRLSGGGIVFYYLGTDTYSNGGGPPNTGTYTCFYQKPTSATGATGYNVGDFEAGNSFAVPNAQSTANIEIPEININMRSEAIVAKTKKLKAVWTPEFAQDLNAYQSIDAEAEVTNILSEYISLEIDLEILEMLIDDAAAGTEYWSAVNNETINAAGTAFASVSGFYNTQGQWFQTLGTKMQKLSNKIHQLTLRGGANWLITSPTVATILESIPGFASNSDGTVSKMEYAFGVQKAGQMNSRYTVYKNPYMTENLILMGFRGTQFLEAGAVFAPYIPLIMTPLVYDPNTFVPRKGLLTRYAKKMLRPEFFGKIYVAGLNTI